MERNVFSVFVNNALFLFQSLCVCKCVLSKMQRWLVKSLDTFSIENLPHLQFLRLDHLTM